VKTGDRVRMSEVLKAKMWDACAPGKHVDPFESDEECMRCSGHHILEFGGCVGVVEGLLDYNNVPKDHPDYDVAKIGPEWNVRWAPSQLRYAYGVEDLVIVP
jgi:hypothetical protein